MIAPLKVGEGELCSRLLNLQEVIECMTWIKDSIGDIPFCFYLVDDQYYYVTGSINTLIKVDEQIWSYQRYGMKRPYEWLVMRCKDEEFKMRFKLTWCGK